MSGESPHTKVEIPPNIELSTNVFLRPYISAITGKIIPAITDPIIFISNVLVQIKVWIKK